MPFIELPAAWITAGKPTKEEIFEYLRDNQDSFNTDIGALKQTSVIDMIDLSITGNINEHTDTEIQSKMPVFKAPVSGSITSVVLTLLTASTSGVLQLDIQKSTDNGANWSDLLSTPVELTGLTPGSVSGAVNFINVASQDFSQNDLIRIVISGLQVNQGEFHVSIYGELA